MTTSLPAGRYGSSRRGTRTVLLVAGVLVVAFLAWLAWSTWAFARPQVTSELQGWTADGPHEVTATVDVLRRTDDVVATCTLRAYAEDHSTVGELEFTVPGRDVSANPAEVSFRTERSATAVELVGCTTPDQSRPR